MSDTPKKDNTRTKKGRKPHPGKVKDLGEEIEQHRLDFEELIKIAVRTPAPKKKL